jgi:hypothetical protein
VFGFIDNRITLTHKIFYGYIPGETYDRYRLIAKSSRFEEWRRIDINQTKDVMKYAVIMEFPPKLMEFNARDVIKVDNNFLISYLVDIETKNVIIDEHYQKKNSEYNLMNEIKDLYNKAGGMIYPVIDVQYLYVDRYNELVITNELYNNDKELSKIMNYHHRVYIIFGIK